MGKPNENDAVKALGVLERGSDEQVIMLAVAAMMLVENRGKSKEVFQTLDAEYPEAFTTWHKHFTDYI